MTATSSNPARECQPGTASLWQPIETNPKDGKVFIIGRNGVNPYSGTAFWSGTVFRDPMDTYGRYWHEPTHWQALPPPPEAI